MDHVHPLPLHFRRPPPPPPRHPPYHDQPNSTSMRISSSSSPISTTPTPSKNTMPSHLLLPPSCPPSFHPDTSSILTSFPSKNKKTSQIPSNKTPITTIATPTSTPTSPSSSFSSSSSYLTMKTTPTLDFNNPTQTDLSFPSPSLPEKAEEASLLVYITTYLVYFVLIVFGHIRDFFGKRFKGHEYSYLSDQNGYAPLCSDFDSFFSRRIYQRIKDCWSRVIASTPGRYMNVLTRYSLDHHATFKYPGTYRRCLNLASYNYLGFAENQQCKEEVLENLELWGMTLGMGRVEVMHTLHHALESNVAKFLNTEEAMCISMGFATNSTTIPVLVNKGCLLISDELNHASIVFGARLSQATIQVFRHNDMNSLESVLRDAIAQGQPRTHRPWKKIMVIVEGLYSMEGDLCPLPQLIELKKKYKFYLFVDEAHSIGALGPKGRGVCDHYQVDPKCIDILMGTFTKSFGAAGGYIAGSKPLIRYLRSQTHASLYGEMLPIPVVQQVLSVIKILMNPDPLGEGMKRIQQLHWNAHYFRSELIKKGFIVYGHVSPVIPMLIFHPTKLAYFSRACLEKGIAVVVVGAPATPLILSRVRFCLSASHTKEDLDTALEVIDDIGEIIGIKLSKRHLYQTSFPSLKNSILKYSSLQQQQQQEQQQQQQQQLKLKLKLQQHPQQHPQQPQQPPQHLFPFPYPKVVTSSLYPTTPSTSPSSSITLSPTTTTTTTTNPLTPFSSSPHHHFSPISTI